MRCQSRRTATFAVLVRAACLGALLQYVLPAWPQSAPDPSLEQRRRQQREDAQRRRLEPNPEVRLQAPAATPPGRLPASESPCFAIRAVRWAWADAADASVLAAWQPWLDASLAGADGNDSPLSRCLGAAGVRVLQERAQGALLARGYTTSRVLIAPQDLSGGVLALTLVPGRIHAIRLADPHEKHASLQSALPIKPGDILNLRDLEHGLENLKRPPMADADIKIEPAQALPGQPAAGPGESDLVVSWRQGGPLRLNVGADNGGTRETGQYQGSVTLSWDNPLGLNDLLYLSLNHDLGGGMPGGRGTHGGAAHYEVPWGYWLLGLTGSQYNYYQSIAGATSTIVYAGTGGANEVALSRVVQRDARGKTILTAKAWQRSASNFINDTEIAVQRRVEGGWELGAERSQAIGAAVLNARAAYKQGTGAFGSLAAPEEAFGEGTSRFGLISAGVTLGVPFKAAGQLLRYGSEWRAQFNRTPLTPLDQFAIGGRYTVRGFDGEQQLAAEHGWLWRNEIGWALGGIGQELYAGIDHGEVGGPSAANLVGTQLTGGVLGLRGRLHQMQYDLFVGAPIAKPQYFSTSPWTVGFSLNWAY
ncbi:MAG: Hemolysin activator protein precursor [Burkholderiaceae bacterium]|nr:MAG: Hemolysin activator protein precursor [Burkholderiaceae bacterium]